ncbi:MAG: thiamine phosphate synthase [Boseongicola sp.]|nr:thiamine phosphate synthase [Boseongicola sp.]NNJ67069.1 thiamine phosphate synthase [Boseongicola sp.]
MADDARPQIYLSTPPAFELSSFPARLAEVLDAFDVACVRLSMATTDEDTLSRAADALRSVCHDADVALVIDTHVGLVERLGLDGVHLLDGARTIRTVRKTLGPDAIVGAFCGASRHDGMTAGEIGADYISFGPAGDTSLGDGTKADRELFQWWSEMIEIPVVAEGALTADVIRDLAPVTDFFGIGEEIWREDDAVFALGQLIEAMS